MPTFSPTEIIGKTLIANKDLPIWKLPAKPSDNFAGVKWSDVIVKKNNPAGVVYSFVGGTSGDPLFWIFETPGINAGQIGSFFYVQHAEGNFNISSLREQGALTTQERAELEAEENMTLVDKLTRALKTGGKYVLIAGSIYFAFIMYKEYKKK